MASTPRINAQIKYNATHLSQINVKLDKQMVADFKAALEQNGDTLQGFFRERILEYIESHK